MTELRSRRILGVFVLIAVLFVAGCSANMSSSPALAVITNPVSQRVAAGATALFSAVASGSPSPSLQWMVSTNGGTSYTVLAGATSATLSFTTTSAMNKNRYEAVFTNSEGSASTTAATLDVGMMPAITTNPTSASQSAGSIVTFTAAASGTPDPTVQWTVSTNGGTTFNAVAGATSTTLSFTASSEQNGNLYEAVFSNTAGDTPTTAATLTVTFAPTITINPANLSVGNTGTATFTAAANGNPTPTAQWLLSTDGGSSFSVIAGATSSTLSFTATSAQSGNLYEAAFTNSFSTSTTTAATLTVTASSANAVAITNPSTQSFTLATGGIVNFAASIDNGLAGTGVNWSVSGVDGGNSTVGTITASTLSGQLAIYTAPSSVPGGGSVDVVATYAGGGSAASSPVSVNIVANQDSTLSGRVTFQVRGFQVSGLPFAMVGTFTADGSGALSNVLIDTNQVGSADGGSVVTSKVAWNGSYAMDSVTHGIIHMTLSSAPATQMNLGFTFNSGNGSLVEIDTPGGSTASGTFNAANSSAFTLAEGGLNGPYVMLLDGPSTGNGGFNSELGQVTFAQTGSSTTAGTVTGNWSDMEGQQSTATSPSTVTMDGDGSGHGTISFTLDNGATPEFSFYVSDATRIFTLQIESGGAPQTGILQSQTIPTGGFSSSNVFSSAMVFDAIGVNGDTGHASVLVGGFSPDPDNPTTQVVGTYDANDGGTVLGEPPVALAGTFIVDPTVPGKGTLTFTNSGSPVISFVFYMQSQGQGFILEQTASDTPEARVGKIVTQTAPGGGFVNATLNGIANTVGTQTTTPTSVNGASVIQFGTGTYTTTSDASTVGQSPVLGGISSGTVNFTDAVRGRATLTPGSGTMFGSSTCVFYSIDSTGAGILISIDPATLEPQIITIGN